MNHLDEGTIHAWLDGAVDATRARDFEAHVATCPACATAVAEARGLIAGASRILNALDDVPAGVTPKLAPRAPPPQRQWRAASWVTGIAAALMLAVGVTTWNRDAVTNETHPVAEPMRNEGGAASAPATSAATGATGAAAFTAPSAAAGAASANQARTEADRKSSRRADAPSRANELPAQKAAAAPAPTEAEPTAIAKEAPLVPSAPSPPAARRRTLADSSARLQLSEVVVTSATEARAVQPLEVIPGCYRLMSIGSSDGRPIAGAAASAPPTAGGGGRLRRTTSAPTPQAVAADFSATVPHPLVRLDTVLRTPGYIVRSAVTDSLVGYWSPWRLDSARATILADGIFVLAARDRVSCPER